MTYLFVGAGQAGGAIVDSVFEHTNDSMLGLFDSADISTISTPLVFNSTMRDLQNLANVPSENQYGIAEEHGLVRGTEPGFEEMVTGGFGRNPVKADEVMTDHASQLTSVLEERFEPGSTDTGEGEDEEEAEPAAGAGGPATVQFAFLFLGLGGGTGCGIAPHIAREIKSFTDGRAQVVAVAVLPNTRGAGDDDEDGAGRQAWNARYGLDRLEDEVDGIVLVDNQRISYLNSAGGEFGEYNDYVGSAIHDMVAGPMLSSVDASDVDGVDTPDIDVRDIVTSLSFGVGTSETRPGYAAIGRSVTMTRSLSGYLLPFVGKRDVDSAALSRLSASKQTLANANAGDAQKAISLIRAPSSTLGRSDGVEPGTIKEFLERSCNLGEVNLGVALSDRSLASVTTLLTYRREDIDRLDEIEAAAEEYEEETEALIA